MGKILKIILIWNFWTTWQQRTCQILYRMFLNDGKLQNKMDRGKKGVLDTAFCDKVCQWFAAGQWFFPLTLVSSTNKTYRHDITEILLKVAFKHHTPNPIRKKNIQGKHLILIWLEQACKLINWNVLIIFRN